MKPAMSPAPTYKEFRTFALARGWTPKDLAPLSKPTIP
jgi:hypothetical protein